MPLIAAARLKEAHVFGVGITRALKVFAAHCERHGLVGSTDTTRFYTELNFGRRFDPSSGMSPKVSDASIQSIPNAVENIETAYRYIREIGAQWIRGQGSLELV